MTDAAALFPAAPRETYEAAPLVEVTCQLHYPTILKIEKTPADFQDRIRVEFPLFERIQNQALADIPQDVMQLIGPQANPINYRFLSEDKVCTLSLNPESIAVSTKQYSRWEEFRKLLVTCLSAFEEIYKPSFYTRIGLRYRNAIRRNELGLGNYRWSDLLNDTVVGALVTAGFEEHVEEATGRVRLRLPDGTGSVLFQHGLGSSSGRGPSAKLDFYILDFDFYTQQKTEVQNAGSTLNDFNSHVGRAFRWCIKPTLHEALRPRPIDD